MKAGLLLILFCCLGQIHAQYIQDIGDYEKVHAEYVADMDSAFLDALQDSYAYRKKIPDSVRLQCLIALAHYPELAQTRIRFKFKPSKIAHTSRPAWWSMLIPFTPLVHQITISTKVPAGREGTMFKTLSYNAQIGVMGHEIAHVKSYEAIPKFKVIFLGLKYAFSKEFIDQYENETDKATIAVGLGHQLKAWSHIVHDVHIADGRGDRYLSEEQIQAEMDKLSIYQQ